MNRKDRAINLGLKIKSLEGNLSVAKSVISGLEQEISSATIDEKDRERLLDLYHSVVAGLKELKSPSVEIRNRVNQIIEDLKCETKNAKDYQSLLKYEGKVKNLHSLLDEENLKKEHKAPLKKKIDYLVESYNKKVGYYLNKNFEKLSREIEKKCSKDNPFHVSIAIKELNKVIQITPLFSDDRHKLQAVLDRYWQKSSKEIKEVKDRET